MPNQGGSHEDHAKAGQQSHKRTDDNNRQRSGQQQADENQRGGQQRDGNFADDREKASEAGRKGGQS